MNSNMESLVIDELRRRGLNDHQIAAVAGSAKQESNFNPYALEKGGTGKGLFQWSYGRAKAVPAFTGDPATDAKNQVDLFFRELEGPERKAGQMLFAAKDLSQAAAAMKAFERYGVAGNRYKYMADYAKKLSGGQLPAMSSAGGAGGDSSAPRLAAGGLDLSAMVLSPEANAINQQLPSDGLGRAVAAGMLASRMDRSAFPSEGEAISAALGLSPQAVAQPAAAAASAEPIATGTGGSALAPGQVVARIARPDQDVFPTTGAHLDVRVIDPKGNYIDPQTWRSGLAQLQVGGKPLFSQGADGQWQSSHPITSGFGRRSAPTEGASTFHRGVDFGVGAGTPVAYSGEGKVSRGHGYSEIATPAGYRIKLLHTLAG